MLAEHPPHRLGRQIQSAAHLVPSVRRAALNLSPANRSGIIFSYKIRSDMLLAHVREHEADLDGKIGALNTRGAAADRRRPDQAWPQGP
jgi:hypothetical protein